MKSMQTGINLEQIMKTIIRILAVACGIASGLLSFTGCSKSTMPETVKEPAELTANINDVNTRTALDGLKVSWIKNDSIAIQTSREHGSNASTPKGYNTCLGTYRLMDDAAGSNVGKFKYVSGDDAVTEDEGDEEFFAFYPASFCSGNEGNGYFYIIFPTNQCYEDNIGEKLPLPMYGIGKDKVIDFKYAGSVIRLRVWSKTATEIHSCTISASGLYKKAFTFYDYKNKKWSSLHPAYSVNNLVVKMKTPVSISTDANNPTVIPIVLPMSGPRNLTNLKFSINCTDGGCELKKKSAFKIDPGSAVNFPVTEIKIEKTRMYVDGLEGEVDSDWIKTAKKSVRVTMPESAMLREEAFKSIMEATRSLNQQTDPEQPFSQIILDLSETRAESEIIKGLNSQNNTYESFCGGKDRASGIKNVSEFRLLEGITQIMNRAFAYSDYTKIVLSSTVKAISGSPSNGNDKMRWEVNANNKYFKTDDNGALYDYNMTTLMVLNGGSGDSYTVQDGTKIIREWALYENSVIKTLTLPATVVEMKENCITGTPNLSTIFCLGKTPAKYVGKNGTKNKAGSSGVKTIYVPKGCKAAYEEAWAELVKEDGWTIRESNEQLDH